MRVQGVGGVIPVEILGGCLTEQPVNGLALGYDLERGERGAPAFNGPASVERTEEAPGTARTRRPEWLKVK